MDLDIDAEKLKPLLLGSIKAVRFHGCEEEHFMIGKVGRVRIEIKATVEGNEYGEPDEELNPEFECVTACVVVASDTGA